MRDYKQGEYVTQIFYELTFWNADEGGGCVFPCDENGNVGDLNPAAERNYHWCLQHPEKYTTFNEVRRLESNWREPNSGICNCGNRIELFNQYMGACECPHCGQWWNLFGQELNNPDTWSDGDDW